MDGKLFPASSFHFGNPGRPSGTCIDFTIYPALKCRAIVITSLRDGQTQTAPIIHPKLNSQNPAVNLECGAGDVAGLGARQKTDGRRHFLGPPKPAHGNPHLRGLSFLAGQMRQRLGFHVAGSYGIHGDADARHFLGQRLCQRDNSRLGRGVIGLTRRGQERAQG